MRCPNSLVPSSFPCQRSALSWRLPCARLCRSGAEPEGSGAEGDSEGAERPVQVPRPPERSVAFTGFVPGTDGKQGRAFATAPFARAFRDRKKQKAKAPKNPNTRHPLLQSVMRAGCKAANPSKFLIRKITFPLWQRCAGRSGQAWPKSPL